MSLLIDGYNLLHVTGIIGRGVGSGGLERSRRALLNFLAESLDEAAVQKTTVVFDAGESAPRQLPRLSKHRGLTVHFASRYADADSLIEELIVADSAPRKLIVVSSDHRIQRAARRRRATAVDSDRWYQETIRHRRSRSAAPRDIKPGVPLSPAEVQHWVNVFSDMPEDQPNDTTDDIFPPGYGSDVTID